MRLLLWPLAVFCFASCALEPEAVVEKLAHEVTLPPADTPSDRPQKLALWLRQIASESEIPEEWRPILCRAVERYQFYHFLFPSRRGIDELERYCALRAEWQTGSAESADGFEKIREILESSNARSRAARENLARLLESWDRAPARRGEFLARLRFPWEVGGVVLMKDSGPECVFVEDEEREECRRHLREFDANSFEHLDLLKERFAERLRLSKVGKRPSSQEHIQYLLRSAERRFAALREWGGIRPRTVKAAIEIRKHRKALVEMGLKEMLLEETYRIDRTPYLTLPETAFFFHSHPLDPGNPHPQRPSGQDCETTFRAGPSLVFDVRQRSTNLYLVVQGESSWATGFPHEDGIGSSAPVEKGRPQW